MTAFKSTPLPAMPSPGGCSSVGDAPSLSFSPLPIGTFAIDFPKEPAKGTPRGCLERGAPLPPMARSMAVGGGGPPAMWTHAKEPQRRWASLSTWL